MSTLNQDPAFQAEQKRIAALEQWQRDTKEALRDIHDEITAHGSTLRSHQSRLDILEPVRDIIEHIAAIKSFFDNWKKGLRQ